MMILSNKFKTSTESRRREKCSKTQHHLNQANLDLRTLRTRFLVQVPTTMESKTIGTKELIIFFLQIFDVFTLLSYSIISHK